MTDRCLSPNSPTILQRFNKLPKSIRRATVAAALASVIAGGFAIIHHQAERDTVPTMPSPTSTSTPEIIFTNTTTPTFVSTKNFTPTPTKRTTNPTPTLKNSPTITPVDFQTVTPTSTPSRRTPTPTKPATPTDEPKSTETKTPSARQYYPNFNKMNPGSLLSDWVDISSTYPQYNSWLRPGNWRIAKSGNSNALGQSKLWGTSQDNLQIFTMMKYQGTAFGSNGQLPDNYSVSETVQLQQSNYKPIDLAIIPYAYGSVPTTYFEGVFKNNKFQIWKAKEAKPGTSAGWTPLYTATLTTRPGDIRSLKAVVYTKQNKIVFNLNGKLITIYDTDINQQPHYAIFRSVNTEYLISEYRIVEMRE